MKGWQIFAHSVRQVTGNIGAAVRISGLLFAVQVVITLLLGRSLIGYRSEADMAAAAGSFFGQVILAMLVMVVTSLWIAVAWHRYVLREETSGGPLPVFRGDRMLGYFGFGILIFLIMIVPAVIGLFIVGGIMGGLGLAPQSGNLVLILLVQAGLQTILGAFAFRLSTVLPGVALEPGHKIGEGWAATQGEMGTFFALSLFCAVAVLVVSAIGLALQSSGLAGTGWEILAQWTVTMVGVSILTTLYGHYIEKRPLV